MRSLEWALIQHYLCPYTKDKLGHRDKHTQREAYVMLKAEVRVMLL